MAQMQRSLEDHAQVCIPEKPDHSLPLSKLQKLQKLFFLTKPSKHFLRIQPTGPPFPRYNRIGLSLMKGWLCSFPPSFLVDEFHLSRHIRVFSAFLPSFFLVWSFQWYFYLVFFFCCSEPKFPLVSKPQKTITKPTTTKSTAAYIVFFCALSPLWLSPPGSASRCFADGHCTTQCGTPDPRNAPGGGNPREWGGFVRDGKEDYVRIGCRLQKGTCVWGGHPADRNKGIESCAKHNKIFFFRSLTCRIFPFNLNFVSFFPVQKTCVKNLLF